MAALLPTAAGVVTGLLIGGLLVPSPDSAALTTLTLAVCALVLASQAVEIIAAALKFSVARRVDGDHRLRIAEVLGRPGGIAHLESAAVQDELSLGARAGVRAVHCRRPESASKVWSSVTLLGSGRCSADSIWRSRPAK
ncbi:hypothetical protein [Streptomyces sp. 8N706]|uniref:hypothetical protein n=1 Tax=Streptomyces sp. 8N706 TaxID=3457416 RepID=UPI003FD2B4DB